MPGYPNANFANRREWMQILTRQDYIIEVKRKGSTIPHDVEVKFNASRVLLRPASEGTGVIAGGSARPILELAGIKDILTKSLGSNNSANVVRATLKALKGSYGMGASR